ncbi:hypothetical protein VPH35_028223 [Triticum aestivum]
MDAKSAKRRNRRAAAKVKTAAAKFAAEHDAVEATRRKAEVDEKEAIVNKAHALLMLGLCRPVGFSVDGPFYNQFMEKVIYEGGHGIAYDPDETQSQDGRAQHFNLLKHSRPDTMTSHSLLRIVGRSSTISQSSKIKYRELQRKRGKKAAAFVGGGDGEALKRPRGKTNSKVHDIRDASSMALHETLHDMMSQKDVRDEKKRQSKEEQMKLYLELQRKKLEIEEAAKNRKIDMEEAFWQRQLDIEAANVTARQR